MRPIRGSRALIADTFLDTNILLYAAGGEKSAPNKHAVAQGLLTTNFGVSAQTLGEFYVNAVTKGSPPMAPAKAEAWVRTLALKPFQANDTAIAFRAIEFSQRYQIHYWDAAILAAAETLGAKTVYTEDLNHGQSYGSVTVINPFLEDTQG